MARDQRATRFTSGLSSSYTNSNFGARTATYRLIGGDQKEYGPATDEEVRHWIAEGRLSGFSLAQAEGGEWRPLSSFPEFAEALREQAAQFPKAISAAAAVYRQTSELSREPGVRRLQIGKTLSRAAALLSADFGLIAGAASLAWMLGLLVQLAPLVGGFLYLLLRGVIYGGLFLVIVKRIRGHSTSVTEIFTGFGPGFSQLAMAGLVPAILEFIGFFCFFPGVFLLVAWIFTVPLVADKRVPFWTGMEMSRRRVIHCWFRVGALLAIAFLPVLLAFVYSQVKIAVLTYPGLTVLLSATHPEQQRFLELLTQVEKASAPLVLFNKLILLVNLPFGAAALMYAYEDLFGEDRTPDS